MQSGRKPLNRCPMAEEYTSWCRLTDCGAAVRATVSADRIVELHADPNHPLGRSGLCGLCAHSAQARLAPERLLMARKRVGTGWEELPVETALKEIAGRLKDIRKASGPSALGIYAGAPLGPDLHGVVRTLSLALAWGTSSIYSPLSTKGGPWLYAVEAVIGRIFPLQADVGRAHYVLLLGANQGDAGWGPLQNGQGLAQDLAHSRKTKSTRVVAADPRRTPVAAGADLHLALRPGTDVFLILGMIHAIIQNKWHDAQYVRDYTQDFAALCEAVLPWTVERCAEICGINATDLQALALKFSHSPMAVVKVSEQSLNTAQGSLLAWAVLALHGITANLLRPGGLYENKGVFDLSPTLDRLPTAKAPHSRNGNFPLLLLQAPGAILADEILNPGEGRLRALISVLGNPARELPGGDRLVQALESLDLLVALDVADTETTRLAHYVLPAAHAWELAGLRLLDSPTLPMRHAAQTPALVPPPGEARPVADLLKSLYHLTGPTLRHSTFGPHLRLMAHQLAGANLADWEQKIWNDRTSVPYENIQQSPWTGGDVDRAPWRLGHKNGRFRLLPEAFVEVLRHLSPPHHRAFPLFLLTGAQRDQALRAFDRPSRPDPGVHLHPSLGFLEGQRVRIRTEVAAVEAIVHLDPQLQQQTVDFPAGYESDVLRLIPTDVLDPFCGTPALNGLPCRVEAV